MKTIIHNHNEKCNIDFREDETLRPKRYSPEAWKKLHIFMQIYQENITTELKDSAFQYVY